MVGIAEQFGKYIMLEKLAAGGMAEVYLALSAGAGGVSKFLAIKRILPQYSENPEFIDMFKEEAKIAVNLNHSNVVSIYDFGIEKNQFFLVMEYVEGKNLRQVVNELKKNSVHLSIEHAVYIAKEVASGLDHAHRCIDGSSGRPLNITHRDMSPQNVMVSFEGEVKVIDFGIAKAETQMDSTRAGTLKGKFGYMSPEQADGQSIDLRTDIFSLGIVLWELLANDRLFAAQNEAAILRKIRECHIPSIRKINPSVSPELERIINKALARDKSLRYQTAAAMQRDLNRYLNTEFPEFSSQDFSVFTKNLFAQHYTEIKKRLVEYARIKAEMGEPTQVTKTLTKTNNSKSGSSVPTESTKTQERAPTKTSSRANGGKKVDLEAFRKDVPIPQTESHNQAQFPEPPPLKTKDKTTAGTMATRTSTLLTGSSRSINSKTRHTSTRGASRGATKRRSSSNFRDEPDDLGTWILRALIIACIVGGGYLYLNKNNKLEAPTANSGNQNYPSRGSKDQSSRVEYITVIDSTPPGAKIFMDGKDTGKYTPHRTMLEGHREFHLALKRDGYITYESTMKLVENATTVRATLMPLPKSAYISVSVVNGGAKPVLEVNGQRLSETPPIKNFAIPANTRVKIRAYNPFTKTSAERYIYLKANQKTNVELVLNQSGRKPSAATKGKKKKK